MSEHEDLVERVAQAIKAAWPGEERMGRAVLDELADDLRRDPPEGCEWVALPVETVDWFATTRTLIDGTPGWVVGDACRDAQARRPKPEPRTERVPAIEALGRDVVSDEGSFQPTFIGHCIVHRQPGGLLIESYGAGSRQLIAPDGKITVLAKDGAEDGAG